MGERVVRTGLSGVSVEELTGLAETGLAKATAVEVVVMTPGPANGWVFTAEALRGSVSRFEGATVFAITRMRSIGRGPASGASRTWWG